MRPGLVPSGPAPLDRIGPCLLPPGAFRVGDLPFAPPGGFAPGAGTMARRAGWLYFGQSCRGGLHRVRVATLRDGARPAEERVAEVETVSPRPAGVDREVLHGLAANPWDPRDPWIYAGDPFQLRLVRVHAETGERQVVSADERLYDFTVTAAFLPPLRRGRPNPLVTVGDQEHRWSVLNTALGADAFRAPFVVTRLVPRR